VSDLGESAREIDAIQKFERGREVGAKAKERKRGRRRGERGPCESRWKEHAVSF
jgi:hypothetical protein